MEQKRWILGVSTECFLPTALFSLRKTAKMAQGAGFDAIEFAPFWGRTFGNRQNLAVPIIKAHGHWNPVSAWEKLQQGGIKGLGPVFIDAILFPPNSCCEVVLKQLADKGIPVSTSFVSDLLQKRNVYSEFQLHPDLGIELPAIIELLRATRTKAVYDFCHMRRKPHTGGGESRLGNWRISWEILNSQDLIGGVRYLYPLTRPLRVNLA